MESGCAKKKVGLSRSGETVALAHNTVQMRRNLVVVIFVDKCTSYNDVFQ